jgi:Ca-activated chloride channel family protein
MQNLFVQLRQKLSRRLFFAICGALGCFVIAIFGEIFLAWALPPAVVQPISPKIQADIMFVLDVTGSMGGEIQGVKNGIQNFSNELKKRNIDAEIGLIAFGDRLFGEEPKILSFGGKSFTSDSASFSRQVGEISLMNGGDTPESSMDALALASGQAFRPQSTKIILLITDAPPKLPDKDNSSIDQVKESLRRNGIRQLHLVINDGDRAVYSQLQSTSSGQIFSLGNVASGREGFDNILPKIGEQIAIETTKGLVTPRDISSNNFGQLLLAISVWTGILAIGITFALIVSQNFYQHKPSLLTPIQALKALPVSLLAGTVAGAIGQILFVPVSSIPFLIDFARGIGWTFLGMLVGTGISDIKYIGGIIPNLKPLHAMFGGAIGGGIGAAGYIVLTQILGEIAGRLIGAVVIGFFIGLMIAWADERTRQSLLIVNWSPNEQTEFTIGLRPIVIGNSNEANVYISRNHNGEKYPPTVAKIYIEEDKNMFIEYHPDMHSFGMRQFKHQIADGDRRKFGKVEVEIRVKQQKAA